MEEGENTQGWGTRTRATLLVKEAFEQSLDEYIKSLCVVLTEVDWQEQEQRASPLIFSHKTK